MPVTVRFTAHGIENAIRELSGIQQRLSDLTPFWHSIALPLIKSKLRQTFLQEGPGWAPLAESTIRSREYPDLPILQQTGALMSSVVDHPAIKVSQRQLLYGTTNPYAQYHESGTYKMPARPFMRPARRAVMDQIRNEFRAYIRRQT